MRFRIIGDTSFVFPKRPHKTVTAARIPYQAPAVNGSFTFTAAKPITDER